MTAAAADRPPPHNPTSFSVHHSCPAFPAVLSPSISSLPTTPSLFLSLSIASTAKKWGERSLGGRCDGGRASPSGASYAEVVKSVAVSSLGRARGRSETEGRGGGWRREEEEGWSGRDWGVLEGWR